MNREYFLFHQKKLTGFPSGGFYTRNPVSYTHLDVYKRQILACTFPWHFYLFRALEKAGRYERCASIWAPYREILARHLTTMPETPGDSRSDCHAWSAVPLFEYVRMNLGVQPSAEKGWEEIVIRPYRCV